MLKDVLSVRPGSIVLFHANGRGLKTAETLPTIVQQLRARGYEFVTVGELLKAGVPEIEPTCFDKKPGDTDRYDGLAQRLEEIYRRARRTFVTRASTVRGAGPAREPGTISRRRGTVR